MLLVRDGDDKRTVLLKGFTIALAVAFNDLKDMAWAIYQLRKGEPQPPYLVSPYHGQWRGMYSAMGRYSAGFMTELGKCIAAAHKMGLLETAAFKAAVMRAATTAPGAAAAWGQLVIAFTVRDEKGLVDPVAHFLKQVRDNSFHYGHEDEFKMLARGYRGRFGAEVMPDRSNGKAYASLGVTQEATRFYFADAAMGAFMESKTKEHALSPSDFATFGKNVGVALRYIVEGLLEHLEAEAASSDAASSAGGGAV